MPFSLHSRQVASRLILRSIFVFSFLQDSSTLLRKIINYVNLGSPFSRQHTTSDEKKCGGVSADALFLVVRK